LTELQEDSQKQANKEYTKTKNSRVQQGRKQTRYTIVGKKLVPIVDGMGLKWNRFI
jgi:hypothetical protein